MLKKTYIILTFVMLTVFNRYLFDNIVHIGEGSCSLELLGMSVALGAVLFFWRWIASGGIFIKYSAMVLALFYIYFVVRIVLDIGEIARLRSMTIATIGGTLLFYGVGGGRPYGTTGTHS